jgi:uncharacterized protein YjbI with pentapeptide repeats
MSKYASNLDMKYMLMTYASLHREALSRQHNMLPMGGYEHAAGSFNDYVAHSQGKAKGSIIANLSGLDLSLLDLSYLDMRLVNLQRSNLTSVEATGIMLDGADMTGVDATLAKLSNASMKFTILVGANLTMVEAAGAVMDKADMSRADVIGVDMTEVSLADTILDGVHAQGASFNGMLLSQKQREDVRAGEGKIVEAKEGIQVAQVKRKQQPAKGCCVIA